LAGAEEIENRTAVRGDLDAIVQLLRRDSIATPPEEPGLTAAQFEAFETIAAHPDNQIVVAELGGELVGTADWNALDGMGYWAGARARLPVGTADVEQKPSRRAAFLRAAGLQRQPR